jgi:hypothetical protein
MTFLLLQLANAALAALSLYIHFRNPHLLDDQALVYSVLTGCLLASITAIALGFAFIVGENKGKSNSVHLVLTLAFAGVQGWLLWEASRELGLLKLIQGALSGAQ